MPDTSPRGEGVADDLEGAYDLGLGAGFYVNALRDPWREHYRRYDYVVGELPALVGAQLPIDGCLRADLLADELPEGSGSAICLSRG